MICRIAREYHGYPHEVAHWPLHYYIAVRNELAEDWKAQARAVRDARRRNH